MSEVTAESQVQAHRMLVGNPDWYDVQSATQFNLLTTLGLRENHYLLDIGCGSLRSGRLFISYLSPGHYFGLELQDWLVQEGIDNEIGRSTIELKKPTFSHDKDFTLSVFNQQFDFMLAHSIFSHTPEYELRRCMQEAAKVMKPTSIFAATYWPGPVSSTDKSWMVRAEFRPEHMQEMVEDAGLVFQPIEWPQHDLQTWFLVLHKDSTVELPDMGNMSRMVYLEQQLKLTEAQLNSIRSHPWVRLGHKIRYALVWVKLLKNLGKFRQGSVRTYLGQRYTYTKKRIAAWLGKTPPADDNSSNEK
jgi:hypothetical protein